MEYDLTVRISGSPIRPPYEGNVKVWTNYGDEDIDFQVLAFRRLRSTSFPEIGLSSVRVLEVKKVR